MNRKTLLNTLISGSAPESTVSNATTEKNDSGLEAYTGEWTKYQAAHLLRRTTFGPTIEEIDEAVELGLHDTLKRLFQTKPLPEPPINHINNNDPNVPIGETWIEAPYLANINLRNYRIQSLQAWTLGILLNNGMSITEKMTLFWHNHFVTERTEVNDPRFQYIYITLLREHALGNFRELTKRITIDPSMLRYLNGNQSTRNNPNENYARELLELFTIGKGPQIAPGDYTNYTENDILEIARVLTGWVITGFNTQNPDVKVGSEYRNERHDLGNKTLSYHFDNQVISNMGDEEYKHLIDIIFNKNECALFIARKLYRWFVYYTITDDIENNIIKPLADQIVQDGYDISPALLTLLGSEHFYSHCAYGTMIKHPVDFIISLMRQSGWQAPGNMNLQYRYWLLAFNTLTPLQMVYYNPPSVAGWKAWYQEPAYYQNWLNSVTLPIRADYVKTLVYTGLRAGNNPFAKISVTDWAALTSNPSDVNSLLEDLAIQLFPRPLTEQKRALLKEALIPGLPDHVWTTEYNNYLSDPGNPVLAGIVTEKLSTLIATMMQMPEYQLS
jgi:uncharacterized protein (DUF1800 family)